MQTSAPAPVPTSTIRGEVRALVRLSAPVVVAQLASMSLWVVDLLMLGRLSVEALDAASLGRAWMMGILMFGMGLVFGIDPITSQAHGSGNRRVLGLALQRGLALALLASVPTALAWLATGAVLKGLGQSAELAESANLYALVQIPGIPFFLLFTALRQWLQGRELMAPAMWVGFLANGINALANWMFIFGGLGAPALGLAGAGIATAITEVFMLVALVAWVRWGKLYRGAWTGWSRDGWSLRGLRRVFRLGMPVAIQISLEFWAFALATFLSGLLGVTALAAHTVVINIASLTFMVPLGIAIASVTRVGNLIGAGRGRDARLSSWVAFGLGGGVMAVSAVILILGRFGLPALYTADAAVIALAASILPICAAFQVFDGVQVVGGGVLRGMGRTRPAAVFNAVAFYGLAMPLGGWLAFRADAGLAGLWWGMALGLAAVSIALVVWIYYRGPETVASLVEPSGEDG